MKITKQKLAQLIKEELDNLFEQEPGVAMLPNPEEYEETRQAPIKAKGEHDWNEFYQDLEDRGLSSLLGPTGRDYKYGKYHTAAKKALDSARQAEVVPLIGPDGQPYAYSTEPGIAKAAAQRAELEAPTYNVDPWLGVTDQAGKPTGPSAAERESSRAKAAFEIALRLKDYPAGRYRMGDRFKPRGGAARMFSGSPEGLGKSDPGVERIVLNKGRHLGYRQPAAKGTADLTPDMFHGFGLYQESLNEIIEKVVNEILTKKKV